MNQLSKVAEVVKNQTLQDNALEEIFKKYFELDGDIHKDNPGYMAWATAAVPVCMALANVILAINNPESGRSFRAMCDLTYQLGANDFWSKNAAVLVPVLTAILNANKDGIALQVEQDNYKEYALYDKLISGTRVMPLEIFSMVLYLVGGPLLMATSSLPLKLALAPYLVK
jgi:hypothetical protein